MDAMSVETAEIIRPPEQERDYTTLPEGCQSMVKDHDAKLSWLVEHTMKQHANIREVRKDTKSIKGWGALAVTLILALLGTILAMIPSATGGCDVDNEGIACRP